MRALSTKEWIAVTAAIVFVGYTMFGSVISRTFSNATSGSNTAVVADSSINNMQENQNNTAPVMQGGVQVSDITVGTGPEIKSGMQVSVNYVLKLADGTLIQDSKQTNGGAPFSFVYGQGQLIKGWEEGITGMKVGGKRFITIPPELGYGAVQVGPIPPNSTLVFEIEVVSAQSLP